jgi:hypothetical protein
MGSRERGRPTYTTPHPLACGDRRIGSTPRGSATAAVPTRRRIDAVGANWGIGGQADAVAIVPDRVNAEALRGDHYSRFVADHPGVVQADSELFHCMLVGPLLGLAEAVLALDLNVVETLFESEERRAISGVRGVYAGYPGCLREAARRRRSRRKRGSMRRSSTRRAVTVARAA